MTMLTPVLNTELLRGSTGGGGVTDPFTPFGRTVSAVLADGSTFLAVWMEDNSMATDGLIRCWRLAWQTLAVIGTADFTVPAGLGGDTLFGWFAGLFQVVIKMPGSGGQRAVFDIDCSASDPVLTSVTVRTDLYSVSDQTSSARLPDGRVVVHDSETIEVWNGATFLGKATAPASTYGGQAAGPVWVDLSGDPNVVGVGCEEQQPFLGYFMHWLEVNVTNPAAIAFTRHGPSVLGTPFSSSMWNLGAAGPPFDESAAVVLFEDTVGTTTSIIELLKYTDASVVTSVDKGRNFNNVEGPGVTMGPGRSLVLLEWANTDGAAPVFGLRYAATDTTGTTPVLEVTDVSYPSTLTDEVVSLIHGSMSMAYDPSTGRIAIASCLVMEPTLDYYSVVAYSVQGPVADPNLSGLLIGPRVRFTGA